VVTAATVAASLCRDGYYTGRTSAGAVRGGSEARDASELRVTLAARRGTIGVARFHLGRIAAVAGVVAATFPAALAGDRDGSHDRLLVAPSALVVARRGVRHRWCCHSHAQPGEDGGHEKPEAEARPTASSDGTSFGSAQGEPPV